MDQEKQYVFGKDMYNYQSCPLVIRIMTIVYPQMIKINFFEHMFNEHLFLVKMSR